VLRQKRGSRSVGFCCDICVILRVDKLWGEFWCLKKGLCIEFWLKMLFLLQFLGFLINVDQKTSKNVIFRINNDVLIVIFGIFDQKLM
jgi:hypothetical protein